MFHLRNFNGVEIAKKAERKEWAFKTSSPAISRLRGSPPKKVKRTKNKKVTSVEEHLPFSFDFLITHASYSGKTSNNTVHSSLFNETFQKLFLLFV